MADESRGSVADLQEKLAKAKESLLSVDENIKKLTGRDPIERRPGTGGVGERDQRRVSVGGQNFRGRNSDVRVIRRDSLDRPGGGGGPPLKRARGSAFSRLGGRPGFGGGRRRDSDEDDDDDIFEHKPALQSSVVATPQDSRTRKDSIAESSQDKKGLARNRRMFGLLLGTLQRFKADATQKTEKDTRRLEIEKKLDDQAQKEKQAIATERRELFQERRSKQIELNKLQRLMELAQMQEEWDTHNKHLCKFIRTKSKPHIFYLPAKMSSASSKLLKESKDRIEKMMTERRKNTEKEIKQEEKEIELFREERRKKEEEIENDKKIKGVKKGEEGDHDNEVEMDDLPEDSNTIEIIEPQVAMETDNTMVTVKTEQVEQEEEEDNEISVTGKEGKEVVMIKEEETQKKEEEIEEHSDGERNGENEEGEGVRQSTTNIEVMEDETMEED
ncbi:pinin-like [Glandiceps talaboti]